MHGRMRGPTHLLVGLSCATGTSTITCSRARDAGSCAGCWCMHVWLHPRGMLMLGCGLRRARTWGTDQQYRLGPICPRLPRLATCAAAMQVRPHELHTRLTRQLPHLPPFLGHAVGCQVRRIPSVVGIGGDCSILKCGPRSSTLTESVWAWVRPRRVITTEPHLIYLIFPPPLQHDPFDPLPLGTCSCSIPAGGSFSHGPGRAPLAPCADRAELTRTCLASSTPTALRRRDLMLLPAATELRGLSAQAKTVEHCKSGPCA